jgi:hypothetical protein
MLSTLLQVPQTEDDWRTWGFAHRDQHQLIRQAIQRQYKINLPEYQLYPVPLPDFMTWLNYNQLAHDDMNGVLQLQSSDLLSVDPRQISQLQAWIYLHRLEHESAAKKLGVS